MRAKGYAKQKLLALAGWENGFLLIISIFVSLLTFLAGETWILALNILRLLGFSNTFYLYYTPNLLIYFLSLIIDGILFIGINFLLRYSHIYQTDSSRNLQRSGRSARNHPRREAYGTCRGKEAVSRAYEQQGSASPRGLLAL